MAMWIILLNSITKGHRGIRPGTVDYIIRTLEAGILACVPSRGSVGASGDLALSGYMPRLRFSVKESTLSRKDHDSQKLRQKQPFKI